MLGPYCRCKSRDYIITLYSLFWAPTYSFSKMEIIRWPRELNAKHLQIKKITPSTWQHTHYKYSQHKQRKKLQIQIFICLCCEYLQCDSLFVCVVSICSAILYLFVLWVFAPPAVKLMKMFSWFAGALSVCMFSGVAARWALSATVKSCRFACHRMPLQGYKVQIFHYVLVSFLTH